MVDEHGMRWAWPYCLSAGLILACGGWLRAWGVWRIQVFGDEIHSLRVISEQSYAWILTNFSRNDACIPYTFYNRLLAETVGLTETLMRLPEILAGTALLALLLWQGKNVLGAGTALASAGFLALSPVFVYMSREARPYSMAMLLVTAAGLLLLDRTRAARTGPLCAAAAMLALSVYLLPPTAPGGAALWLLPLVNGLRSGNSRWVRPWLIATGVGLAVGLATLGPALPSFHQGIASKSAQGAADLETVRHGLLLLHGLPVFVPVWAWAALGLAGTVLALRKHASTLVIVLALAVQLFAIHVARPIQFEISWVWLRYWVHLFPLLLLVAAAGYASLLDGRSVARKAVGLLGAVLLAGYAGLHLRLDNYAVSASSAYPAHPMVMMMNYSPESAFNAPASRFYTHVLPGLDKNAWLVESPAIFTFPLYGRYTPIHQRRILVAGVGNGFAQQVIAATPGLQFRTSWPYGGGIQNDAPIYWVHHHDIKRELADWLRLIQANPHAWSQMDRLDYYLEGPKLDQIFGVDTELEAFAPDGGVLVYEDTYVRVYRLGNR